MELRDLLRVLRRRWWIWLGLPLVTLAASLLLRESPPPVYQASMRVSVGVEPRSAEEGASDPVLDAQLASEYIADTFSVIVESGEFARTVGERLEASGIPAPQGSIQGTTFTQREHRIVHITVTWGTPEGAAAIAQAVAGTLEAEGSAIIARYLQVPDAQVALLDPPSVAALGPSLRERLEIPLRVALALLAGLALALLVEYFDSRLYERAEVERLGLSVLGEIPRAPGGRGAAAGIRDRSLVPGPRSRP